MERISRDLRKTIVCKVRKNRNGKDKRRKQQRKETRQNKGGK